MIEVTREQAEWIRKNLPNVHVKSTRNKAYVEAHPSVIIALTRGSNSKCVKTDA